MWSMECVLGVQAEGLEEVWHQGTGDHERDINRVQRYPHLFGYTEGTKPSS